MTTETGPAAVPAARTRALPVVPAARDAVRLGPDESVPSATAAPQPRVVILGTDAALELALRESAAGVSFVTAQSLLALADVIVARPCDALVIDLTVLGAAPARAVAQLAAQFPDLPIVAVGSRTDEAAVAGLISKGQVYRFLHRPLSPARARALLGAALRRHTASSALKPPASGPALAPPIAPALPRPPRPLAARPAAPLAAPESALRTARGSAASMSPAAILACGIGLALLAVVAWWLLGVEAR